MNKDYEIYHYKDKKMRNVALHQHDFYEIFYYITGEVHYQIEGRAFELSAGDLILVNTKELHQAWIESHEKAYERIVLWLNPDFLTSLSTQQTDLTKCFENPDIDNLVKLDFETQQDIKAILLKLLALENAGGYGGDLLYKIYIIELMIKLNNLTTGKNESPDINTRKSELIDGMIAYIEAHLSDDLDIDMLAEKFYLSKYHLSREFKKYIGITLYRYIILKRLIIAKQLILENHPITDVYIQCGFGDYSNFFRAFKNEFGLTPKQYHDLVSNK